MVIGFDFDKVFIDYPPFIPNSLVDFLYKGTSALKRKKAKKVSLHYRFPGAVEQRIRVFSHNSIFRKPIDTNINVLKKIVERKKEKTYLVSSRFSFLKLKTYMLLDKYSLNQYFDGIFFNFENKQPHIFKEQTIKKLKIDTYVDDDLDLSLHLASKLPYLKIYWVCGNKKTMTQLPNNVRPIKDLKELYNYLFKK